MINNENKKNIEILILIFISLSPLLSKIETVIIIIGLIIANLVKTKQVNKNKFILLLFFLMIFTIGIMYDSQNIRSISQLNILNLYFPMCFFLGFLISQKYNIREYLCHLEKITFIIAIISLGGVLIYTFLPSLVSSLPSYSFYHTSHKTAYLCNFLIDESGNVIKRNAGIAWEPGAYQLLLNIALYHHIKFDEKHDFFKICIYSVTIFTTKSTTGIICLIITTFNIMKSDKRVRWLVLISILLFSNTIIKEINYQLEYKLVGSNSFNVRLEPMLSAYKIGKDYFFGLGNSGYDLKYQDLGVGAWDSFGQIFIRYGYILFFTIILSMLRLLKNYKNLFIILVATFISQTIWFFVLITPFYFFILDPAFVKRKDDIHEDTMGSEYTIAASKQINE